MKPLHTFFITLGCCLLAAAVHAQNIPYRFATRAEAQMLITDIDNYTRNWNQFDIDVRLQKQEGRKSQLLTLAMNETRNWADKDKERVNKAMKEIAARIGKNKFVLHFPKELVLVKTSMKEENNMPGYTRENWIAIGENTLNSIPDDSLQYLLCHEIFHILTRTDATFRRDMYQTIGFTVLDRDILFPADMIERRISNPDISRYDSYGSFTIDGSRQNCTVLMYTDRPYAGGKLSEYAQVGLIPLNEQFIPLQMNGKTVVYPLDKAEDFHIQMEKNAPHASCPEEILADNFACTVLNKAYMPNPEIAEQMRKILSKK